MAGPSGSTPILNLPYPTASDTVNVPRDVQALATALDSTRSVPVGALLMWPVAAPPAGWLICNGTQVDAASYPLLAAVLGSSAGKITLPNLADRVPIGGGTRALNSSGGAATVTLSAAQLPAHKHAPGTLATDTEPAHVHSVASVDLGGGNLSPIGADAGGGTNKSFQTRHDGSFGIGLSAQSAGAHAHAVNAGSTGDPTVTGGSAHENLPPYLVVNFIIRAS